MSILVISSCVVGALVLIFVVAVLWDVFVPKACECGGKLTCLNFIRVNPGPSYSTFRCRACGQEFVQVAGKLEPRIGSKWEHEVGW